MNFRKILDKLPILIYVAHPDAVSIQYYNETWTSFTGFSLEEMKDGWGNVVHKDDVEWMVVELNKAVKNKTAYSFEFRLFRRSTNNYVWMLASCTPIFNENKEIIRWVGTLTDINLSKISTSKVEEVYKKQILEREGKIKELEDKLHIHKILK